MQVVRKTLKGLTLSLRQDYSPLERLAIPRVWERAEEDQLSMHLWNNLLIGADYFLIMSKYSKCYLCSLPILRAFFLNTDYAQALNSHVITITGRVFERTPPKLGYLKWLGRYFYYPNKQFYSTASLFFYEEDRAAKEMILKVTTAIQAITFGSQLHNKIETNNKVTGVIKLMLAVIGKTLKDKYLVLAGDYFHIMASVLGTETGSVQASMYLSQMQIKICKHTYLLNQLKSKIEHKGYQSVQIDEIHKISLLKSEAITLSFQIVNSLSPNSAKYSPEVHQCVALLLLYRKDFDGFKFNVFEVIRKFKEYKRREIQFCDQYSLSRYLFFQSAQKTQRIDLAYLNTVKMLSEEIKLLENKLMEILGPNESTNITHRINHMLMFHL